MASDQALAERIRDIFTDRFDVSENKLFDAIAWIVSGNMCCGIAKRSLMVRVDTDQYPNGLKRPFASETDLTGRSMKGLVYLESEGIESDEGLENRVALRQALAAALPTE